MPSSVTDPLALARLPVKHIQSLTSDCLGSLSSFGPGSAFGFAPVTRQPRRTPSSGSYTNKDPALSSPSIAGPQPVDHHAPTLGAWGGDAANGVEDATGRSFSSILAPIPDGTKAEAADPLAKPFVYSREFLLGLYDDEKAKRRPIELVANEVATRDSARKPWALEDWREGEKEVSRCCGHFRGWCRWHRQRSMGERDGPSEQSMLGVCCATCDSSLLSLAACTRATI